MASIFKTDRSKTPGYGVQFIDLDGERRTIRLGKAGHGSAKEFARKVELLLQACRLNLAFSAELAIWLGGLADDIYEKLAGYGLVQSREVVTDAPTISAWFTKLLAQRTDLKPSSRNKLERTKSLLLAFFTDDPPIDAITADGAKDWRAWLQQQPARKPKDEEDKPDPLSEGTVRLHCRNVKAVFNEAVERELIQANPFKKLAGRAVAAARERYVTPEEATRLIDACPSVDWKALIGLARLAGLRVPSETHILTWADVDWERKRLRVRSPKTERYKGHESREVPLAPELASILQDAFDNAAEGQEYVLALSRNNLHRTLDAIVTRAKLAAWPRRFQTLRQSCETEWSQKHPQYAVSKWLGHSEQVSREHYLMIPDELFDAVAGGDVSNDVQRAAKSAALNQHNATQRDTMTPRAMKQEGSKTPVNAGISDENEDGPGGIRTPDQAIMSRLL